MRIILYRYILAYCLLSMSMFLPLHCFKLGVENISSSLLETICPGKKGTARIGLITNQTGVDQQGNRTVDILQKHGFKVGFIFVPEHGLNGTLAERNVSDSIDQKTGIAIISLYGNGSGKMIQEQHLGAIDVLIFDIQDSGMRHYTYISTLLNTMKIAALHNKPFIVFDRPNPLGSLMEGPLVDPSLISFISIAPIPLRHGMTVGELGFFFNNHILPKKVSLRVVTMSGYDRRQGFVGNFIHQLSPNLQSLQSVYGYSFLGLLGEIEPFDVGVGTPLAFRCITLPCTMNVSTAVWRRLQNVLSSFGIKSSLLSYRNRKNKKCRGLTLEFSAISDLHSFEVFIAVLQFFKKENIALNFSSSFNKAVGTTKVQDVIAGVLSETLFFNNISVALQQFYKQAQASFLYGTVPIISKGPRIKTTV